MDLTKLVWAAAAAALIGVPFHLLMKKLGWNRTKGERIVAAAKKAGRVVTGRLTSSSLSAYQPGEQSFQERQQLWHVTYEYRVGQKDYCYRTQLDGRDTPPQELSLYYPKGRPDRAVPEGGHRYDSRDVSIVLLPVVLWAVFYWIL